VSDLIANILDLYLDIKHWFNVKKRRKFEKEKNLSKSIVLHPLTKPLLVFSLIFIISTLTFFYFRSKDEFDIKTKEKLTKISKILEDEKQQFGSYPKLLKSIIRNNPLRQNINQDFWKNEFVYTLSKDSLNYNIISLGKDQILNTLDDIKITNK
jgi:hypothetical protein